MNRSDRAIQPMNARLHPPAARVFRGSLYLAVWLFLFVFVWYILPASITYVFTERYGFSAPAQDATVRLAVLIPRTGPYQQVEDLNIEWDGATETESSSGADILRMEGDAPAGNTAEAVLSYRVTLRQGPARWQEPPSSAEEVFPQKNVESDAPEIRAAAEQLRAGRPAPDAYAIFDFTAGRLSWPVGTRIHIEPSAVEALRTGIGGCEEFANLMTAVARASGIPARTVAGLALPAAYPPFIPVSATWSHPGGAHAWVEILVDGSWLLADPGWASAVPGPLRGLWFGRNDGSHLSYGEASAFSTAYGELEAWVRPLNPDRYAAMSAPLHFAAAASADDVVVTPGITLTKSWDGRWAALAAVFAVWLAGIALLERISQSGQRQNKSITGKPETPTHSMQ